MLNAYLRPTAALFLSDLHNRNNVTRMARAQISIDPGSMSDPPFLMFLAQMRTYQDSLGVCHLSAQSHLVDNPQNQGPLCSARV